MVDVDLHLLEMPGAQLSHARLQLFGAWPSLAGEGIDLADLPCLAGGGGGGQKQPRTVIELPTSAAQKQHDQS